MSKREPKAKEKYPFIQLYTGDWLKDPELSMCSPLTRGIWMDLICAMHENGRVGNIRGTLRQLTRLCRCDNSEMEDAIEELEDTKTADVTNEDGIYTVVSRRLHREWKERESAKLRKRKSRKAKKEHDCHSDVTAESRDIYHISEINISEENIRDIISSYPRSNGSKDEHELVVVSLSELGFEFLLTKIQQYLHELERFGVSAKSDKFQYVPGLTKWLNEKRWVQSPAEWTAPFRDFQWSPENAEDADPRLRTVVGLPEPEGDWASVLMELYPTADVRFFDSWERIAKDGHVNVQKAVIEKLEKEDKCA